MSQSATDGQSIPRSQSSDVIVNNNTAPYVTSTLYISSLASFSPAPEPDGDDTRPVYSLKQDNAVGTTSRNDQQSSTVLTTLQSSASAAISPKVFNVTSPITALSSAPSSPQTSLYTSTGATTTTTTTASASTAGHKLPLLLLTINSSTLTVPISDVVVPQRRVMPSIPSPSVPPSVSPTSSSSVAHQQHQHQQQQQQQQQQPPSSNSTSPHGGNSTSPAAAHANSPRSGLPVALLWLPYAVLTLFLTALLIASFVHFHCKNGHKYKRRRSASSPTAAATTNVPGNGSSQLQSHEHETSYAGDCAINPENQQTSFIGELTVTSLLSNAVASPTFGIPSNRSFVDRGRSSGSGQSKSRSKRLQSVEFVSNHNGSMVNMRGLDVIDSGDWGTSEVGGNSLLLKPINLASSSQRRLQQHCRFKSDDETVPDEPPVAAQPTVAFRSYSDSRGPGSVATSSSKPVLRSTKDRVAPSVSVPKGRLGGIVLFPGGGSFGNKQRQQQQHHHQQPLVGGDSNPAAAAITSTSSWPTGALYSAVRICTMDETADDWNRLLAVNGGSG